jgi:hypothetical protein
LALEQTGTVAALHVRIRELGRLPLFNNRKHGDARVAHWLGASAGVSVAIQPLLNANRERHASSSLMGSYGIGAGEGSSLVAAVLALRIPLRRFVSSGYRPFGCMAVG